MKALLIIGIIVLAGAIFLGGYIFGAVMASRSSDEMDNRNIDC